MRGTPAEAKVLRRSISDAVEGGSLATALELCQKYTSDYPECFWGWITVSDIFRQYALYRGAEDALREAEKLAPKEVLRHVFVRRARLSEAQGTWKDAEKWYRRAIKVRATAGGFIYLGALFARMGKYSEAKRCHQRAARFANGERDEAYLNLGLIARAERNYEKALGYFERAIRIDPNYREAKVARDDVLRAMRVK